MIWLFTDFTDRGPYLGQMRAVLLREAPEARLVDLMHDVPPFRPRAGAHLLAACVGQGLPGDIFLCVVDPGVGTARGVLVVEADGRIYVGPDNGLLEVVSSRAKDVRWWEVRWRPAVLSASFHGRDLFAPVAARLARGESLQALAHRIEASPDVSGDDLAEVIYIDGFGNAMTGLRAAVVEPDARVRIGERVLEFRRTFGAAGPGELFWYENSLGLVEVAANGASAGDRLGLAVGDAVSIHQ